MFQNEIFQVTPLDSSSASLTLNRMNNIFLLPDLNVLSKDVKEHRVIQMSCLNNYIVYSSACKTIAVIATIKPREVKLTNF